MGALAALVANLGVIGVIIDVVIAVAIIVGIFLYSRRTQVTSRNLDKPEPGVFVRPKRRKKAVAS